MRASRLLATIFAVCASVARAQDSVSICSSERLLSADSALNRTLIRQAASSGFVVVMDSLRRAFAAQLANEGDARLRAAFLANMDTASRELDQVLRAAKREDFDTLFKRVLSSRMRPTKPATQGWILFARDNEGFELDATLRARYCPLAIAATAVLDEYARPGLEAAAQRMQERAERWRAWHDNAPTLYPWELGFNNVVSSRRDYEPPPGQWLLLHPTPGIELSGTKPRTVKRFTVAVMEWLGYSWNFGNFKHSAGLSAISTFPDDLPASLGVLARYGKSFTLSAAVRDVEGMRRYGFSMSVDLYGLLTGTTGEIASLAQIVKK